MRRGPRAGRPSCRKGEMGVPTRDLPEQNGGTRSPNGEDKELRTVRLRLYIILGSTADNLAIGEVE